MNILSVQSWVASGHVGNAAAILPLQMLGAEVTAIHTVQFSNHPGHGAFAGRAFPAADTAALVAGLDVHGVLARCDAVLSGYLGDAATGAAILDAVARVRAHRAAALWCCDPVMGDEGRLYVAPEIPRFFAAQAVPAADILVPNQFELARLTGEDCRSLPAARAACAGLRARMRMDGPRLVLVSSLQSEATPRGSIDLLLAEDAGDFLIRVDRLDRHFSGAGDTLAALFLAHVLRGLGSVAAAERATASLAGLLHRTEAAGSAELLTVAARDEFAAPTLQVRAAPL